MVAIGPIGPKKQRSRGTEKIIIFNYYIYLIQPHIYCIYLFIYFQLYFKKNFNLQRARVSELLFNFVSTA